MKLTRQITFDPINIVVESPEEVIGIIDALKTCEPNEYSQRLLNLLKSMMP